MLILSLSHILSLPSHFLQSLLLLLSVLQQLPLWDRRSLWSVSRSQRMDLPKPTRNQVLLRSRSSLCSLPMQERSKSPIRWSRCCSHFYRNRFTRETLYSGHRNGDPRSFGKANCFGFGSSLESHWSWKEETRCQGLDCTFQTFRWVLSISESGSKREAALLNQLCSLSWPIASLFVSLSSSSRSIVQRCKAKDSQGRPRWTILDQVFNRRPLPRRFLGLLFEVWRHLDWLWHTWHRLRSLPTRSQRVWQSFELWVSSRMSFLQPLPNWSVSPFFPFCFSYTQPNQSHVLKESLHSERTFVLTSSASLETQIRPLPSSSSLTERAAWST